MEDISREQSTLKQNSEHRLSEVIESGKFQQSAERVGFSQTSIIPSNTPRVTNNTPGKGGQGR